MIIYQDGVLIYHVLKIMISFHSFHYINEIILIYVIHIVIENMKVIIWEYEMHVKIMYQFAFVFVNFESLLNSYYVFTD
jgi:hypothetical protein